MLPKVTKGVIPWGGCGVTEWLMARPVEKILGLLWAAAYSIKS